MKNYELITALSAFPAGAEIKLLATVWGDDTTELGRSHEPLDKDMVTVDDDGNITLEVPAIDVEAVPVGSPVEAEEA